MHFVIPGARELHYDQKIIALLVANNVTIPTDLEKDEVIQQILTIKQALFEAIMSNNHQLVASILTSNIGQELYFSKDERGRDFIEIALELNGEEFGELFSTHGPRKKGTQTKSARKL